MNGVINSRMCFLITTAVCIIFYATSAEASADTYLGCYEEYGTDSVFVIPTSNAISSLTPEGCRENCRKDVIYSFAGLWGGNACYCASGLNAERIKPVNDSLCYSPCPGKSAEFCGGSNTLYIFSVHSVCPRGLYGRNCANKCNCKDNKSCTVHGLCPGDECAAGWRLNNTIANRERCSIDVNECQTECRPNSIISIDCHNCNSVLHQECKNTKGSFVCICADGYKQTNNGTCADIDECAKGAHNCSQICNNTEGSYKCSCPLGYELQGSFDCIEINECAVNTTNCEHACINMDGSYYCVCRPGYKLHFDRHRCVDVDECQTPCSSLTTTQCYQCTESYECHNTIGSFKCMCKRGFSFNSQLDTCEDIDECNNKLSNCNHTCTNTNGSYVCGCLEGFELEDDGHSCVVAESGLWKLVVGLALGTAVQSIAIVALAITVCILLAKRNFKPTATDSHKGNEVEEEPCAKMSLLNVYAHLDSPTAIGCRSHPLSVEYDHLHNPQVNDSQPYASNEYDQLDHLRATDSRPNQFYNTVNHPQEIQEDRPTYLEIV